MKTLVAYFSYSGKTMACALAIANELKADVREIRQKKEYKGFSVYIFGGRDSLQGRTVELVDPNFNLDGYDTIVLASPVWGFSAAAPIASFARGCDLSGKKAVILLTMDGTPGKAVEKLSKIIVEKGGAVAGDVVVNRSRKSDEEVVKEAVDKVVKLIKGS